MVRPPVDHFIVDQKYLVDGPLILAIIIHTPVNTRNSPYETFSLSILVFIFCSNIPSMK